MKNIPEYDIIENIKKGINNPEKNHLDNAKNKLLDKKLQKSLSKVSKIKRKKKKTT